MRTSLLPLFSLFCLSLFFITACKTKESAREKMYVEVMSIHDAVMPEMSTIHRLKKQLKAIDTAIVKVPNYPTILQHLGSLEKADEGMMSWMAEFSNPTADTAEDIALSYLKKEREKISEVRDQMLQSIASAKSILLEAKTTAKSDSSTIK